MKSLFIMTAVTLISFSSYGVEPIKGTKNFRASLNGVLYIGGGNQMKKRDNRNPLLNETLDRLCEAGFKESIFLYTKQKSKMRRVTKCSKGSLSYDPISWVNIDQIMKRIHNNIINKEGPLYAHCYNGVHAANAIGAIARIQFCGASNKEAMNRWLNETDDYGRKGYKTGKFNSVKKRITRYKYNSNLSIPADIKQQICN